MHNKRVLEEEREREREREKGAENTSEDKIAENSSSMGKEPDIQVQEAQSRK